MIVSLSNSFKNHIMYVGQLAEKNPYLEVKFCCRIGKTSSFHWPVAEDRSIITDDQVYMHLPKSSVNKRGKIIFGVTFCNYNIGWKLPVNSFRKDDFVWGASNLSLTLTSFKLERYTCKYLPNLDKNKKGVEKRRIFLDVFNLVYTCENVLVVTLFD